jgi:hypothetical protein
MIDYTPDLWVMVKLTNKDGGVHYRIFASWYGGFGGTNSWKLNSGVTKIEVADNYYDFHGSSGSVYRCGRKNYGTSGYSSAVLADLIKRSAENVLIEELPDDTNFEELNYE